MDIVLGDVPQVFVWEGTIRVLSEQLTESVRNPFPCDSIDRAVVLGAMLTYMQVPYQLTLKTADAQVTPLVEVEGEFEDQLRNAVKHCNLCDWAVPTKNPFEE